MVKASSGIAEFERVCFGDLLHVSILGNVVCISPALEKWAHCCPDSLFRELTLANAIDTAAVVDGLSLYPCRSEVAALHLARYFADLVECVFSSCT